MIKPRLLTNHCCYLSDSLERLPKLVEDIVQTSVNTGPRGAIRLAQGIQAVIGVGGEWLADVSKVPLLHLSRSFWDVLPVRRQVRKECVEKSKPCSVALKVKKMSTCDMGQLKVLQRLLPMMYQLYKSVIACPWVYYFLHCLPIYLVCSECICSIII